MIGTILIADDYEDNRVLLRVLLEQMGHRIVEARDGRECLEMARVEPPDLALIDLSMPVLDGWGVLSELRADERTRHIPCVAFTASPDSDRKLALDRGFDGYISKPFRSKDLHDTIERLLAERQKKIVVAEDGNA